MSLEEPPRTEAALRQAIAVGEEGAWHPLARLLPDQPGREDESEAAYREAAGDCEGWLGVGTIAARGGRHQIGVLRAVRRRLLLSRGRTAR